MCALYLGALVYIASEDPAKNENYLGPASVGELAAQIASARGPSGPNAEYLYRLVDALVQVGTNMLRNIWPLTGTEPASAWSL